MSPRLLTRNSSFSLLPLALAFSLASALPSVAIADDSSQISAGPVSAEEAKILWQDGKLAFDQAKDELAIPKLERFVARYPGYPDYLEARHVLARAYLRSRQPAKAKAELQSYIGALGQERGKRTAVIQARLELGRADLELNLHNEALLTAEEILKLTARPDQSELRAEALWLRARAQLGLGQDTRAASSIAAAQKLLPESMLNLAGELKGVELQLRLRQCERFPSNGKLEEDQVRDQLSRRGTCLLDALLLFKQALDTRNAAIGDKGSELITQAYDSYWLKCVNPPGPPPIRPTNRGDKQLKTYFRELSVVLEEDCHQKIRQGIQLIAGWKSAVSVRAAESLSRTAAALENMKK